MNHNHPYMSPHDQRHAGTRCGLSRREWLIRSTGVIGFGALGGWQSVLGADETPQPENRPGRAQSAPSRPVAIQRCESYEPALIRQKLDAALAAIGGIGSLVQGKTVTMKVN